MKFWANVRLKGEKNAAHLIRAFFQNFDPESSISIRGNEAKLEIVFNEPPMDIIEAMSYCEILEMNYGKDLTKCTPESGSPEQVVAEEEIPEQVVAEEEIPEQVVAEEEIPEQVVAEEEIPEQVVAEKEIPKQVVAEQVKPTKRRGGRPPKQGTAKQVTKQEPEPIPELEEMAKKATSFNHFVRLVAEWLEMDRRQVLFEELAIAATEIDKVSWKELEKVLNNKAVSYTQWDKVWAMKQVSEKITSVTMLPLLNVIKKYKEYSFKQEDEIASEAEDTTILGEAREDVAPDATEQETKAINEDIHKPRVKMECMPEIVAFEEVLGSVDKTQPIEERVLYVLNAMGLDKMPVKEKKQILEIANTAVRKERIAFDIIFIEAKIPMEEAMKARMTFSKFIKDFVGQYESEKNVKLLDFLSELQKIIMLKSEIESFSDFTEN